MLLSATTSRWSISKRFHSRNRSWFRSAGTARKYKLLPLAREWTKLTVAMADPSNVFAMDDVKFMTGYNIERVVAPETKLLEVIDLVYGSPGELYEPWVPKRASGGTPG